MLAKTWSFRVVLIVVRSVSMEKPQLDTDAKVYEFRDSGQIARANIMSLVSSSDGVTLRRWEEWTLRR